MERKYDYRMGNMVLMEEVIGGRIRGRPGWVGIDGVKVEDAQQCAKGRKEWRALVHMKMTEFYAAICVPVFFQTSLPRFGGLSPG